LGITFLLSFVDDDPESDQFSIVLTAGYPGFSPLSLNRKKSRTPDRKKSPNRQQGQTHQLHQQGNNRQHSCLPWSGLTALHNIANDETHPEAATLDCQTVTHRNDYPRKR
jgi:hypothetical protein